MQSNYRNILIRASRGREIADSRQASKRDTSRLKNAKAYAKDAIKDQWNETRCLAFISNFRHELACLIPKTSYEDNLKEINTLLNATT